MTKQTLRTSLAIYLSKIEHKLSTCWELFAIRVQPQLSCLNARPTTTGAFHGVSRTNTQPFLICMCEAGLWSRIRFDRSFLFVRTITACDTCHSDCSSLFPTLVPVGGRLARSLSRLLHGGTIGRGTVPTGSTAVGSVVHTAVGSTGSDSAAVPTGDSPSIAVLRRSVTRSSMQRISPWIIEREFRDALCYKISREDPSTGLLLLVNWSL